MGKRFVTALTLGVGAMVFAGENLVVNGDFEAGTATAQAWGSYANGGGYSNPGWTVAPDDRVGLGKPNGVWCANDLDVGELVLFIQTQQSETSYAYQDIEITEAGNYLVSFNWGGRPGHLEQTTVVTLGDITLASLKSGSDALQRFSTGVSLTPGTYRLQFTATGINKDVANWFDAIDISLTEAVAYIGWKPYTTLAEALADVSVPGTVIDYSNLGNGSGTLADGTTFNWNGLMPSVHVAGTLTVDGTVTLNVLPFEPGTYTLFTAENLVAAPGSFVLGPVPNDVNTYALEQTATALTLTVARNPAAVERVANGAFDDPATWIGSGNGTKTGKWGYSWAAGFCLPGWSFPVDGATGSGVGLAVADSDWVAPGQTNGGTYTYFAQGHNWPLVQDFAPAPAGIYRLSYARGCRPTHGGTYWRVGLRRDGETIYSYQTVANNNQALDADTCVIALPEAGNYGLSFVHEHPDTGDRAALLDDVSFRLTPVEGWSLDGATTRLTTGAAIPTASFVNGDAAIAADATLTVGMSPKTPALNVAGTLRLEGTVTLTLKNALDLKEGDYRLVKAAAIECAPGASFVLDPTLVFRNPVDWDAGYDYFPVLDVQGGEVILRLRNFDREGANNYFLPPADGTPCVFTDGMAWSRGHAPDPADSNIILNHAGTLHFEKAETLIGGRTWYFRNGHFAPIVLTAATPEAGCDFRNTTYLGGGDNGTSGWIDFKSGTYALTALYAPCQSGGGGDAEGELAFNGATVSLTENLQCNWSSGSRTRLTVSAGSVTVMRDFNANIVGNTHHTFRMRGGTFEVSNFQVYSGLSVFDGEMTGGELRARKNFSYGNANSQDSSFRFRLAGGRVRADTIVTTPATNTELLFWLDGGALAPWAGSEAWAAGATFAVTKGGVLRLDSAGTTATWCGVTADTDGGQDYALTKEGAGAVRFASAPTAEGPVSVTGGALVLPAGTVLKGTLAVAAGAVLGLEPDEEAELAEGDVLLTAEGGITLAATAQVAVAGGSATLSADGTQLLYATADTTPVTAVWTGAGDRANVSDPANWSCQNASGAELDGVCPGPLTKVVVTGPTSFNVPAGQTFEYGTLEIADVVLTADCDWRGLDQRKLSAGTIDLAGHELILAGCPGDSPRDITVTDTVRSENLVLNGDFSGSTISANAGAWGYANGGSSSDNWAMGSSAGIAKAGSPWTGSVASEPFAAYIQRDSDQAYIRQTVTVPADGRYRLAFVYIPRQATAMGEAVDVLIDGVHRNTAITTWNDGWMPVAFEVELTAGPHELQFQGNNLGSTADRSIVLDDISLTRVQNGRLVVDVPQGVVFDNKTLTLTGELALVKEGPGTMVASVSRQAYRGGTEVRAGVLRSNVSGSTISGFGATLSAIAVRPGATFDDNGMWDINRYEIVLDGGTLANYGGNLASNGEQDRFGWGAFGCMRLTADAQMRATANVLFRGNSTQVVDLGGHTLTVSTSRNYVFLGQRTVNGTFKIVSDQTMFWTTHEVDASTVDFDLACALEIYNPITVHDWTIRRAQPWGWSSAPVKVNGTFNPVSDYFCETELQNGATLYLAEKAGPWNVKSLDTANEKTYLTSFAEGATITVDVGDRKLRSNERVVAWDEETEPANLDTVTFKLQAGRKGELLVKDDGLYFFSGLTLILR